MLLIFDLSGLVHRAWHGQPHAAGRLAFAWMAKIVDERNPTHVAAAVDRPWPTWRHDLAFKSGAVYKPPEKRTGGVDRANIMKHMRIAEELAEDVLGVRVFGAKGFEGDDVVATLAAGFPGGDVLIAARDKDFCQLLSERVALLDFASGVLTRPADVLAKHGVPPSRFVELQALIGDKTDGYSGCPGVGPKAALEILTEFDDLEKALLNAETVICGGRLSQTNRRKLREGAASTRLSHALATLRTDAPLRGLESFDDLRALPVPDGVL